MCEEFRHLTQSYLDTEVTNTCDVDFVDVKGAEINNLIKENPYYRTAAIPAGMYKNQDAEALTFGVGATFVSSADVADESVYVVVKAVFDNFADFKKLHPAFANLKEEEMMFKVFSAQWKYPIKDDWTNFVQKDLKT